MLKRFDFQEEPVLKINWWKIQFYLQKFAKKIIQTILKIMTLIVKACLWLYKKISRFCKSRIKGYWLLLFIIVFLILLIFSTIGVVHFYKQQKEEIKQIQDIHIKTIKDFKDKEKDYKKEIEKLKEKASIKQKQEQSFTSGWDKIEVLPDNVKQTIKKYSSIYGVDQLLVQCIVANESSGRAEAVGDSGLAVGVSQYHLATFLGHRKQMGLSQEDLRTDIEASIQAMCWSISNGGIGNWTARWKCT
jgi:cell division protein FtsB